MTKVTLRPNATVAALNMSITGGAGSVHASLADGPDLLNTSTGDTTYVGATGSSPCTALCDLTTVTIGAGSVTKSLLLRARCRTTGGFNPGRLVADVRKADQTVLATLDIQSWTGSFAAKSGVAAPVTLTQSEVDGLRVYGQTNKSQAGPYQVVWAGAAVDLVYVTAPTVTVSGPTGTINTDQVAAVWSYDQPDADGGPQDGWEVAVFTAAQYGIGGFDPATSPASGRASGTGAAGTATVSGMPDGVNMRVYVRAFETINGQPHWSAWANSQFTISTTRAQVSTLTAAAVPASARVDLTVARDTGQDAWTAVEVQRQVAGVWSDVAVQAASGNSAVVADRLAPSDVATLWRARAQNASGTWGAWVETASPLTWTATAIFLRDALTPATELQMPGWELDGFPSDGREVPQSVFDVVGSGTPVVVSDVPVWRGGSFKVECADMAEVTALVALLSGRVLVVCQPLELGPMIRLVPSRWRVERGPDQSVGARRFVTVDFQRVG